MRARGAGGGEEAGKLTGVWALRRLASSAPVFCPCCKVVFTRRSTQAAIASVAKGTMRICAWFIGFNDTLITGVWVGNDDRTPMKRVTGGSLPAAIWKRFMTEAATAMTRDTKQLTASVEALSKQPTPEAKPPTAEAPSSVDRSVAAAPTDQAARAPSCDYQACARAYESFRASDCTYQPYSGAPRQLCDKNPSQRTTATPLAPNWRVPSLLDQILGRARCNNDVCARFYSSFDPADCTYRPYDGGPRRLCTR